MSTFLKIIFDVDMRETDSPEIRNYILALDKNNTQRKDTG